MPLVIENSQVLNPQVLDVFLGQPTGHLLIFTGIGVTNRSIDDDSEDVDEKATEVIVKLGRFATSISSWTAVVALANIFNTESDFKFATDDASVQLATDGSGQIELHTNIAVKGDDSTLLEFSYQVHVIVLVEEPLISGLIVWNHGIATETGKEPLFDLTAVPAGGQALKGVAVAIGPANAFQGISYVSYSMSGGPAGKLPFNMALDVHCTDRAGAFKSVNGYLFEEPLPGSQPVTLTGQQPKKNNVNFVMKFEPSPK